MKFINGFWYCQVISVLELQHAKMMISLMNDSVICINHNNLLFFALNNENLWFVIQIDNIKESKK